MNGLAIARHPQVVRSWTNRTLPRWSVSPACLDLPGYELFQYVDDNGTRQAIDSSDVNAYLREICGDDFTAKDHLVNAIESVAPSLANTKTVCRLK